MVYDTMDLSPIALWFMILKTMVYDAYTVSVVFMRFVSQQT